MSRLDWTESDKYILVHDKLAAEVPWFLCATRLSEGFQTGRVCALTETGPPKPLVPEL